MNASGCLESVERAGMAVQGRASSSLGAVFGTQGVSSGKALREQEESF